MFWGKGNIGNKGNVVESQAKFLLPMWFLLPMGVEKQGRIWLVLPSYRELPPFRRVLTGVVRLVP